MSVSFASGGVRVDAWHYRAEHDGPRPCVVMGHGFAATKLCGLDGFASAFAGAGLDVLAFDYRGFGSSDGTPRQHVDPAMQRADFHAAIAYARGLLDVDRIVLWGVSLAGGHVLRVGAEDGDVAAVISLTPAPDGRASSLLATKWTGPAASLKLTLAGARGEDVPIVSADGRPCALPAPGAHDRMLALAGPDWENRVTARSLLPVSFDRPVKWAAKLRCPVLVQVADDDTVAPPDAAMTAAWDARAIVHHYPCDHFDVYPGTERFDDVVRDELAFLARHVTAPVAAAV